MTTEKTLFDEVFMAAITGCLSSDSVHDPYGHALFCARRYVRERDKLLKEVSAWVDIPTSPT